MASNLVLFVDRILNLPRTDLIGYCDPFVKVTLGGVSARTTTIQNTSDLANPEVPVWGQQLTLAFPTPTAAKTLEVELWDEDTFSNELIARTSISLENIKNYTQTDARDDLFVSLPLELAKGVKPCAHGASPVLVWRAPQWRPTLQEAMKEHGLLAFDALTKLIQAVIQARPNEYGTLNPKWSKNPDVVSIPCQDVDEVMRLGLEYNEVECALTFRCMTIVSRHDNLFLFVFPEPEKQTCKVCAVSRPFVTENGHEFTSLSFKARHFSKISDLLILPVARGASAQCTHTPVAGILSEHGVELGQTFEQLERAHPSRSLSAAAQAISLPLSIPGVFLQLRFNQNHTVTLTVASDNSPYIFDFVPTEAIANGLNGSKAIEVTKDHLCAAQASAYPNQDRSVHLSIADFSRSTWKQAVSITLQNGDPLPAIVSYIPKGPPIPLLRILPLHGFHAPPKPISDLNRPYWLAVNILSAANVPTADINSASDPFVQLTLDKQLAYTPAKRDAESPRWHEKFVFGIPPQAPDASVTKLSLALFDRDTLEDQLLGSISQPISAFFQPGCKVLPLTLAAQVTPHPQGVTTLEVESQSIPAFSTLKQVLLKHYPQLESDDTTQTLYIPLEEASKALWLSIQYCLNSRTLCVGLNDVNDPSNIWTSFCDISSDLHIVDHLMQHGPNPKAPYRAMTCHFNLSDLSYWLNRTSVQFGFLESVQVYDMSNILEGLRPFMSTDEFMAVKRFKVDAAQNKVSTEHEGFSFDLYFYSETSCRLYTKRDVDSDMLFDFYWIEQAASSAQTKANALAKMSKRKNSFSRTMYRIGNTQSIWLNIPQHEHWPVLELFKVTNQRTWSLAELLPALVQVFKDIPTP